MIEFHRLHHPLLLDAKKHVVAIFDRLFANVHP